MYFSLVGKVPKVHSRELRPLENPLIFRGGNYVTLRPDSLVCSAWLDGPPVVFGFSGAQLEVLFLRGLMTVGGLLRLNQPSYRQSPSIRSRGPSVLCAQGSLGTDFSVLPQFLLGRVHYCCDNHPVLR